MSRTTTTKTPDHAAIPAGASATQLDGGVGTAQSSWRALADRLTPAQVRHLAAVERLALTTTNPAIGDTAADTLGGLTAEAHWYVARNPEPGVEEPSDLVMFRRLLNNVTADDLTADDIQALLNLARAAMDLDSLHPVDSTVYACCRGIGGHSRSCLMAQRGAQ